MATFFHSPSFQRPNPVFWQEHLRLRRGTQGWRRWEKPIILLVGLIAFGFIFCFWQTGMVYNASRTTRQTAILFSLMVVWIVHTIVSVRSIIAGVTIINREYVGQTWDSLVLTGISSRQILLGKFRAALRPVLPWMLLLAVVRLALLPLMSTYLLQRIAFRCYSNLYGSGGYNGYEGCYTPEWVPWAWLSAPLLTIALTALEVVACVALGLAMSALNRSSISAVVYAITARFLPIATFVGFARYELGDTWLFRYLRFSPFTLADGGTAGLIQLAYPITGWSQGAHAGALPGLFGVALLLGAFCVGAFALSLWAIKRGGALSQTQPKSVTSHADEPLPQPAYSVFRLG
jgi:hypothetical protein